MLFSTFPYIDSDVNHNRHFIKIPFINKGMEFIDLHSIYKDNSVISFIPTLSLSTGTIACDHYVRECEFGILKKKKQQNKTKSKNKTKKNKKNISVVF